MNIKHISFFVCLMLFFFFLPSHILAQKKPVKLINLIFAETLENGTGADGVGFQRLIKNVQFEHAGAKMWCDSAHFYRRSQKFFAFGNIRIKQGDSINISSKKLQYNGRKRIAKLQEDVVYRDDSVTIKTNFFDYDMTEKLAYYYNGGEIIDDENVLVSEKGYYHTDTRFASFKKNAILTTPEAIITSDTLQYDINSAIAYFKGPTEIKQHNGTILNASQGKYITKLEKADIRQGTLETKNYIIKGDQMLPDDKNLFYQIKRNVTLFQKKDNITITGNEAIYNKKDSIAIVYGEPVLRKIFTKDTMYMKADTLLMIDNPAKSKQFVQAFHHVRVIKNKMSSVSDSLTYHSFDSLMRLDGDPIVWNGNNQVTSDSMKFFLNKKTIDRIELYGNAFVVDKDTVSLGYNQVKGRVIKAFMKNDSIDYIDVLGNAESVYFLPNQEKTDLEAMNNMACANMRLTFSKGKISTLRAFKNPEGKLIPPFELKMKDEKLSNFKWRENEKPIEATFLEGTAFSKKKTNNEDLEKIESMNKILEDKAKTIDLPQDIETKDLIKPVDIKDRKKVEDKKLVK